MEENNGNGNNTNHNINTSISSLSSLNDSSLLSPISSPIQVNQADSDISLSSSTPLPLPRPSKQSITTLLSINNSTNSSSPISPLEQSFLSEFYSSECLYVENLNYLVNSYISPIIEKVNNKHVEKILPFFQLIKSIQTFHLGFLIVENKGNNSNNAVNSPTSANDNSHNPSSVMLNPANSNQSLYSIFIRYYPYLQLYLQYSAVYQQSLNQLKTKSKQSKKLKAIIYNKNEDKERRGEEFFGLLNEIILRINSYVEFLEKYKKIKPNSNGEANTGDNNNAYSVVESLQQLVEEIHVYSQQNTELDIESMNSEAKSALKLARQISPPSTPGTNNSQINNKNYKFKANGGFPVANALTSTSAGSSISIPPINEQIFRYVPRLVLERFLSTEREHQRLRMNTNLLSLLPTKQETFNYKSSALLVADVSGFTKLNEQLKKEENKQRGQMGKGAESVTIHLNKYFTNLLNIIESHGGDCVKFAGDALIVAFPPEETWTKVEEDENRNSNSNSTNHDNNANNSLINENNNNIIEKELFPESQTNPTSPSEDTNNDSYLFSPTETNSNSLNGLSSPSPAFTPASSSTNSNDLIQSKSKKFRFSMSNQKSFNSDKLKQIQSETCIRAVQCALQLQQEVGVYTAETDPSEPPIQLSLHIGISTGSLYGYHLGGYKSEWEFLLAGNAFKHIGKCLEMSKTGEVLVTKKTWELISSNCEGQPITKNFIKTGDVKIIKVMKKVKQFPLPQISFDYLATNHSNIAISMRSYVPKAVLDMLDARRENWLAEIRTITVIFVNLKGLILNKHDSEEQNEKILNSTQAILVEMQRIIHRNEGYRRQFLLDDKGTTLIVVFGVTPYAHEDDAYRSIKTAFEIREKLMNEGVNASYGIATGTVYVGSLGSSLRQEHAVVGDIVNISARLSGKAADNSILIDDQTHDKTKLHLSSKFEGEIAVKGKKEKIKIYSPIKFDRLNVMQTQSKGAGETMNRNEETAVFMNCLVELQTNNKSSNIVVEGVAGIGKTHLIRNFYKIATTNNNLNVFYTKGDQTEANTSLSCWTPIIESLMKLSPPAKNGSNTNKRTKQVIKYVKNLTAESGSGLNDPRLPFINLVLSESVNIKHSPLSNQLKGQQKQILVQAQNFVFYLLKSAIENLKSKGKFTVLFVEDLHSLDAASVQVLFKLMNECKPLLIVVTARPPNDINASNSNTNNPLNKSNIASKTVSRAVSRVQSRRNSFTSTSTPNATNAAAINNDNGSLLDLAAHSSDLINEESASKKQLIDETNNSNNPASNPSISPQISSESADLTDSSKSSHSFDFNNKYSWTSFYPELKHLLPNLHWISLEGLNLLTCTRLVCQRLQALSIDSELSQLIMKRSQGNPLYATEVAAHLLDKGYINIRKSDGHVVVSEGKSAEEASLDLPTSLKGLVIKRIDSLPVNDLLLCKLASAFGSEDFSSSILIEIGQSEGMKLEEITSSLNNLIAMNIIAKREETSKQREFREENQGNEEEGGINGSTESLLSPSNYFYFVSELTHSACYDMLLFSQKLKLHKLLAEIQMKDKANNNYTNYNERNQEMNEINSGSNENNEVENSTNTNSSINYFPLPPVRVQSSSTCTYDSNPLLSPTSSSSSSSLPSISSNPVIATRRLSILSYHYSMALHCYNSSDSNQTQETKNFIQTAKNYLNKQNNLGENSVNSNNSTEESKENTLRIRDSPLMSPIPSPRTITNTITSAFTAVVNRSRKNSIQKKQIKETKDFNSTSPPPIHPNTDYSKSSSALPSDYLFQFTHSSFNEFAVEIQLDPTVREKILRFFQDQTVEFNKNKPNQKENQMNENQQHSNHVPPPIPPRRPKKSNSVVSSAVNMNIPLSTPIKRRTPSISVTSLNSISSVPSVRPNLHIRKHSRHVSQSNLNKIQISLNKNKIETIENSSVNAESNGSGINVDSNSNDKTTETITTDNTNNTAAKTTIITTTVTDAVGAASVNPLSSFSSSSSSSLPPSSPLPLPSSSFSSFFFKTTLPTLNSSSSIVANSNSNINNNSSSSNNNNNPTVNSITSRSSTARSDSSPVSLNFRLLTSVDSILKLTRFDFISLKQIKNPKPTVKLPLEALNILIEGLNPTIATIYPAIANNSTDDLYSKTVKSLSETKFQSILIKSATLTAKEKGSISINEEAVEKLKTYLNNQQLAIHRVNSANSVVGTLWKWVKTVGEKLQQQQQTK